VSDLAELEQLARPTTPPHRGGFDTYQEQARRRSNNIRSFQKKGHPTRADTGLRNFS
jgi:hypothetical protein